MKNCLLITTKFDVQEQQVKSYTLSDPLDISEVTETKDIAISTN